MTFSKTRWTKIETVPGLAAYENEDIGSFFCISFRSANLIAKAKSKDNIHEKAIQYLKGESSVVRAKRRAEIKQHFLSTSCILRRKTCFFSYFINFTILLLFSSSEIHNRKAEGRGVRTL